VSCLERKCACSDEESDGDSDQKSDGKSDAKTPLDWRRKCRLADEMREVSDGKSDGKVRVKQSDCLS